MLFTDRDCIDIPADNLNGEALLDSVKVTANRSWSARVVSGMDWLEIGTSENRNLDRTTNNFNILLKAEENRSSSSRKATVRFSIDGKTADVTVRQAASSPRLLITTPHIYEGISSDGADFRVVINANTKWKATVDPSSTAVISTSAADGFSSEEIVVTVAENGDFLEGKTGKVTFSAEGCEDVVLTFNQDRAVPYFRLLGGEDSEEFEAGRFNGTVGFRTNTDWTAEIIDTDGFDSPLLRSSYGGKLSRELVFKFKPANCFGKTAFIKVKVTLKDVEEPLIFTFTQQPVIRFMFRDPLTEALVSEAEWPFTVPSKASMGTNAGEATNIDEDVVMYHYYGYAVRAHSKAGIWRVTDTGFDFGGAVGNYFSLPAVPGFRLVKVYIETGQKAMLASIRETDLTNTVDGGETWSSADSLTNTWILGDTEPGCEYMLVSENTSYCSIRDMILYYE